MFADDTVLYRYIIAGLEDHQALDPGRADLQKYEAREDEWDITAVEFHPDKYIICVPTLN